MKKILMIGANSALAKATKVVLDKDNTIITAGKKACDIYCDVTETVTIPDETEVIINFAAVFGGETDEEIINAERTNALGTLQVCIAAKQAGVKHIISISSLSVVLDKESAYYTIYAITKKQADELAQFYCALHNIPLTILRPSQIYGDSDDFAAHQPFFYEIVDRAQKGQDIFIYGENDALRNYIHSADLSETINRVVIRRLEGVFPCMYPSDSSYSQIAQTAQKVFDKGGDIAFLKDKPNTPDNIFTKDLTIYQKIDYSPKVSVEAGLRRIKAFRERKTR